MLVRENCVYTLDDQRKFLGLFASEETSPIQIESQLEDIAKQVPFFYFYFFDLFIYSILPLVSFYVFALQSVKTH